MTGRDVFDKLYPKDEPITAFIEVFTSQLQSVTTVLNNLNRKKIYLSLASGKHVQPALTSLWRAWRPNKKLDTGILSVNGGQFPSLVLQPPELARQSLRLVKQSVQQSSCITTAMEPNSATCSNQRDCCHLKAFDSSYYFKCRWKTRCTTPAHL